MGRFLTNESSSNSGSLSSSQSSSSLDYKAKSYIDSMYQRAIGLANPAAVTGSYSTARQNASGDYEQLRGMMEGLGDAEKAKLVREGTAKRNSVGNTLANTGLYNSTMLETQRQAVDRNTDEAVGAVNERIQKQQAEMFQQRISDLLGIDMKSAESLKDMILAQANLAGQSAGAMPMQSQSTSASRSGSNSSSRSWIRT